MTDYERQMQMIDDQVENQKLMHEPEPIYKCDICNCNLFAEDHCWFIEDQILCDECADGFYGRVLTENDF